MKIVFLHSDYFEIKANVKTSKLSIFDSSHMWDRFLFFIYFLNDEKPNQGKAIQANLWPHLPEPHSNPREASNRD